MIDVAHRRRGQAPPPWVIFERLANPGDQGTRPWLFLRANEVGPSVLDATHPSAVVWSSLWPQRPDAKVRFDIQPSEHGGSDLTWTLSVDQPVPDEVTIRSMRKRVNELINGKLRSSFGA